MNVAEWILVVMLSIALFIFLVAGIVLVIKLIRLANEAQKIVITGQGIAAKADDIVDNVKGMTTVGGIVKTFANRVIENQERKYAEEDAMREAANAAAAEEVYRATSSANQAAASSSRAATAAARAEKQAASADRAEARANYSAKVAKAAKADAKRSAKKTTK